jgi:rhamnosyltransferase
VTVAQASVIVRSRDSERTIERTFASLRAQTVEAEIVVVDSGSRDATLEIATRWADRILHIAPAEFTYGRALNVGAREASGDMHFALSSHCSPPRADWIERSLVHYDRDEVAATNGGWEVPGRRPLGAGEVFLQDHAHAKRHPRWGFSNHASSWRSTVLAEHPFDETLDYAEDKEWALRVTRAGWLIAFDPELMVDGSHAWTSALDFYDRKKRSAKALASFAELPPYGALDLMREWWSDLPDDGHSTAFTRFVNYRRMAGLLGWYAGRRAHVRR